MGTKRFINEKEKVAFRKALLKEAKVKAKKAGDDPADITLEDIPVFIAVNVGPNRKQRRTKLKKERCKRKRSIRGKVYQGDNA